MMSKLMPHGRGVLGEHLAEVGSPLGNKRGEPERVDPVGVGVVRVGLDKVVQRKFNRLDLGGRGRPSDAHLHINPPAFGSGIFSTEAALKSLPYRDFIAIIRNASGRHGYP